MFLLRKWYLDVVTDRGTALIAYAARLRWGPIRLSYASVLHAPPSESASEQTAFGRVEAPRLAAGALSWRHAALDVSGRWCTASPSVRRTLLRTSDGAIVWACHMPSARATVRCGDKTVDGVGYVERLSLSLPPWKLPFRTLRWGRYASDRHAVVWIEWAGEDSRRFVWLDGVAQPDALIGDAGVSGLAGGAAVTVGDARDVCRRRPLTRVVDRLPAVARRAANPLAEMREHKQLARSSIVVDGRAVDRGWTIFEVVGW